MDVEAAQRWDRRYADMDNQEIPQACYALKEFAYLLPTINTDAQSFPIPSALDLGCGRGGNALLLSELGFDTHAWDISSVAIDQLDVIKAKRGVSITCQVRDVIQSPPQTDSFDVIVVSRFLHRSLADKLVDALRSSGMLYYQTFTMHARSGPKNPDYLLKENELLSLFSSLDIRIFIDNACAGNNDMGLRGEAIIVAQKP